MFFRLRTSVSVYHVCVFLCCFLGLAAPPAINRADASVNVTTQHNDNSRTGANLQETILTPANVGQLGKLFSINVDGQIFAQPLYLSQVSVPGQGIHNIVYIATMNNSLYALDADTGKTLWQDTFGTPVIPADIENHSNITRGSDVGILGTPVIDRSTNTIYFVSRNESGSGAGATFTQSLNAIDTASGAPKFGSPKLITGIYISADGTLTFDPKIHNQRAALTLANGNVYIAWASHDDLGSYHGWVMAYRASDLSQVATYCTTTAGSRGGIWQSGQGLTVDPAGNLLFSSGNGSFGASSGGVTQAGNSFVKLSPTLGLLDYFTPYNSASLNAGDQDLGSSGLLGIPGTTFVVGGGKQGVLYLVDSTTGKMSHFNSSYDQVVQEWKAVFGSGSSHIHGTPVYFNSAVNGPTIYLWGENDSLKAFAFNASSGLFNPAPIAHSTMNAPMTNANSAMPGGFLSVSANGGTNGIIWASTPYNGNALQQTVPGVLHAFDANTLNELWSDKKNEARDEIGNFAKFVPPTVANGKLYAASFGPLGSPDGSGALVVYGLPNSAPQFLIADGNYRLVSVNSGLALDVPGASTTKGVILIQNTVSSAASQVWKVKNLGGNVITLTNLNSGQVVDVYKADTGNSVRVEQWPANGGLNQQWLVAVSTNGSFTLTCQNSSKVLDVVKASTSPGAQINQYQVNGNANQKWKFVAQ